MREKKSRGIIRKIVIDEKVKITHKTHQNQSGMSEHPTLVFLIPSANYEFLTVLFFRAFCFHNIIPFRHIFLLFLSVPVQ